MSTGEEIAKKKSLVFYKGRVPNGVRTNWIMHEYNPTFNFHNQVLLPSKVIVHTFIFRKVY